MMALKWGSSLPAHPATVAMPKKSGSLRAELMKVGVSDSGGRGVSVVSSERG